MIGKFHAAIIRQAGLHEIAERGADLVGVLRADQPEADLGAGLCGQHGLEPGAGISPKSCR